MPHRRQGHLVAIAACLPLAASCVPAVPVARPAIAASSIAASSAVGPRHAPAAPAGGGPGMFRRTAPMMRGTGAAPPFHLPAENAAQAERATECLTAAIYYEARSEGEEGQRAVAQVVLNRVRHRAYPATICGVVYQRTPGRTCQFTFSCDGSTRARREPAAWAEARRIAEQALAGAVYAPVGLSTHYHTQAVSPAWGRRLARVTIIGAHIFYGGPGGSPLSDFVRRTSAPQPAARPTTPAVQAAAPSRPHRAGPAPAPAPAIRRPPPAPGFDFADESFAGLSDGGPGADVGTWQAATAPEQPSPTSSGADPVR